MELLRQFLELHSLYLLGYCLMSNHVHLIVIPRSGEAMAQTLKHTHGRYASYWNARNSSSGHVWQGRSDSCPLDETHLWGAHCGNGPPDALVEMERWRNRSTVAEWGEHPGAVEQARDVAVGRHDTQTG